MRRIMMRSMGPVLVAVFAVSTVGLSQESAEKEPAKKSIEIDDPAVIEEDSLRQPL